MSKVHVHPVPDQFRQSALVDADEYAAMYRRSVENNEEFWGEQAERLDWITPFTEVKDVSFDKDDLHIRWFADGLPLDRSMPV